MSVFLTPDGQPFYGGTYFPDRPRHGMPSFRQVLAGRSPKRGATSARGRGGGGQAHGGAAGAGGPDGRGGTRGGGDAARARRGRCRGGQSSLRSLDARRPGRGGLVGPDGRPLLRVASARSSGRSSSARSSIARRQPGASFDPAHGGWGGAPKFPQPMTIELLLREHLRTGDGRGAGHGAPHAGRHGRGRHPRPARRRLRALRHGRRLAGAPLREDALRQRPARPRLPPRLAGHR